MTAPSSSGRSSQARCPARPITSKVAFGIKLATVALYHGNVIKSSAPCTTSVGQPMFRSRSRVSCPRSARKWAAVPAGFADGYALSDAVLAEARVFLTPGGIFGSSGNGYIRASLCQPEALLREALARVSTGILRGHLSS